MVLVEGNLFPVSGLGLLALAGVVSPVWAREGVQMDVSVALEVSALVNHALSEVRGGLLAQLGGQRIALPGRAHSP